MEYFVESKEINDPNIKITLIPIERKDSYIKSVILKIKQFITTLF